MKLAIVGSRSIKNISLDQYISKEVSEIVSGGTVGIDRCAAEYAKKTGLIVTEFFPLYDRFGRAAPIIRNKKIVEYADYILIFWDGSSGGTKFVIDYSKKLGKPFSLILLK